MNLIDIINNHIKDNSEPSFAFVKGQSVRVLKSLEYDTYAISDLLGNLGIVIHRFCTNVHRDNKYIVRFPNGREEEFDETELDKRFIKRKNNK